MNICNIDSTNNSLKTILLFNNPWLVLQIKPPINCCTVTINTYDVINMYIHMYIHELLLFFYYI